MIDLGRFLFIIPYPSAAVPAVNVLYYIFAFAIIKDVVIQFI